MRFVYCMLRLAIFVSVILFELAMIIWVIVRRKFTKKKIIAMAVPLLMLLVMFFSGIRIPSIVTAEEVKSFAGGDLSGLVCGTYGDGEFGFSATVSRYKADFDEMAQGGLFSKEFETEDGKRVFMTGTSSRRLTGEFYSHQGYEGRIFVDLGGGEILDVYYFLCRYSDNALGCFFAPPVFEKYSLSETVVPLYKGVYWGYMPEGGDDFYRFQHSELYADSCGQSQEIIYDGKTLSCHDKYGKAFSFYSINSKSTGIIRDAQLITENSAENILVYPYEDENFVMQYIPDSEGWEITPVFGNGEYDYLEFYTPYNTFYFDTNTEYGYGTLFAEGEFAQALYEAVRASCKGDYGNLPAAMPFMDRTSIYIRMHKLDADVLIADLAEDVNGKLGILTPDNTVIPLPEQWQSIDAITESCKFIEF